MLIFSCLTNLFIRKIHACYWVCRPPGFFTHSSSTNTSCIEKKRNHTKLSFSPSSIYIVQQGLCFSFSPAQVQIPQTALKLHMVRAWQLDYCPIPQPHRLQHRPMYWKGVLNGQRFKSRGIELAKTGRDNDNVSILCGGILSARRLRWKNDQKG